MQLSYWKNILYTLKLTSSLVKVPRVEDGDTKPPISIYEVLDRTTEAIANSF